MKVILKASAIFISILLLVYLLASFIAWDMNPGKWDIGARFMSGFLGTAIGAGVSVAFLATHEDSIWKP